MFRGGRGGIGDAARIYAIGKERDTSSCSIELSRRSVIRVICPRVRGKFYLRHCFIFNRLRDEKEVNVASDHYEGGTTSQPTLLIKNSTRDDQGVYACILGNEVGETRSSNAVYVNITCEFPEGRKGRPNLTSVIQI